MLSNLVVIGLQQFWLVDANQLARDMADPSSPPRSARLVARWSAREADHRVAQTAHRHRTDPIDEQPGQKSESRGVRASIVS